MARNERKQGRIARILLDKGFGFIQAEGEARELFFHRSACRNRTFEMLKPGDKVTFEEGSGAKGPRAENVEEV